MISIIKELINPLPGYTIFCATSKIDDMVFALLKLAQESDGRLNLALYQTDDTPPSSKHIKTQLLESYDDVFRVVPRDNDIVILYETYAKHTNKTKLLKNVYMSLANAGHIIIVEPKEILHVDKLKDTLQEHEFRAPNSFDAQNNYNIVMAKKMHMWGNGL